MADINKPLAQIFQDMASIYQYLGGAERFRALAYLKASRVIRALPNDLVSYIHNNTLENIEGIGDSIAEKIKEFAKTGKIRKYEELKKVAPHELMDMMQITGFGPQSLKTIHEKLGIDTREEMIKALNDGRISHLKGFGEKKVNNMLRGLKLHKTVEERMPLWQALELSNAIAAEMKKIKEIKRLEIAGSVRRRKETIGDVDVLASCAANDRKKTVNRFVALPGVKAVLAQRRYPCQHHYGR